MRVGWDAHSHDGLAPTSDRKADRRARASVHRSRVFAVASRAGSSVPADREVERAGRASVDSAPSMAVSAMERAAGPVESSVDDGRERLAASTSRFPFRLSLRTYFLRTWGVPGGVLTIFTGDFFPHPNQGSRRP